MSHEKQTYTICINKIKYLFFGSLPSNCAKHSIMGGEGGQQQQNIFTQKTFPLTFTSLLFHIADFTITPKTSNSM